MGRWEHFDHGADIGVRGIGSTPSEAFAQAAIALTAVITDPASVSPNEVIEIHRSAPDLELLLADWLDALILEMATRKMLFGRFEVSIVASALVGRAFGEKVDRAKHRPAVEVKGATYTELRVFEERGEWTAQCVVDV